MQCECAAPTCGILMNNMYLWQKGKSHPHIASCKVEQVLLLQNEKKSDAGLKTVENRR